jgi:signal transduction histidine kinase
MPTETGPARQGLRGLVDLARSLPPLVADGLLAVGFFVLGLVGLFGPAFFDQPYRDPDAIAVALIAAQTLPLAWRRRRPGLVLAAIGMATATYLVALYLPTNATLAVLVAVYTFAAHADRFRATAVVLILAVLSFVNVGGMVHAERVELTVEMIVVNYLIFAAAWLFGDNMRRRREQTRELEERAVLLERERDERAKRAVDEERTRIARELHDVVAHNVSVMVVQAGAGRRLVDKDPDRVTAALRSIEQVGRQALTDMRRLLGVLRPDDDGFPSDLLPQPTLEHLDGLIETFSEAGLPVGVTTSGEPRPLPSGIDLTAYRIIQEALTNTLKHAGPSRATVTINYAADHVGLEITDDGRGLAARGSNGGQGLLGMRERVALFGGNLDVGPRPGGGFRVRAHLPLEPTVTVDGL